MKLRALNMFAESSSAVKPSAKLVTKKKKLNKQRPGEESVGRIIYALKCGLIKFDNELDNRGATFVIVKERIF